MTDEQGRLPLREEPHHEERNRPEADHLATTQGPSVVISDILKALDKARKAVSLVAKRADISLNDALAIRKRAIAALQKLTLEPALRDLEHERDRLVQRREDALIRRREELKRCAERAMWVVRRMTHGDYVGCFKVTYKQERVTVHVGSEILARLDEFDGVELFTRLQEAQSALDAISFHRDRFFRALKDAISLARSQGQDRDGKVPIRKLYPLMVLVRQSRDDGFLKRPMQKSFSDYSSAQFVYDLARFARDGWSARVTKRLSSQTPNMATISRGATMTLPSLDGHGVSQAPDWRRVDRDKRSNRMTAGELLGHLASVGTPPEDGVAVSRLSVGLEVSLERFAHETLPFVASGGGELQLICGTYGRGKTHYLKALSHVARERQLRDVLRGLPREPESVQISGRDVSCDRRRHDPTANSPVFQHRRDHERSSKHSSPERDVTEQRALIERVKADRKLWFQTSETWYARTVRQPSAAEVMRISPNV